jgi:fructose-bisphosphate aldolase class II
MMERGRRILANIPGVRAVFTGRAETPAAKYQYCWLVRFAHPAVIDSYRDHPDHVAFANAHFRPIAADRLTIDFRRVE